MTPSAHVAGQVVGALGKVGSLTVANEWPEAGIGGPASAEFTIQLPPANRPGWLVKDQLADVRFGGLYLLSGWVTEADWSDPEAGKITINGASREGEITAALTAAGVTSTTPDTFIDAAITRGALTWTRPATISTTALASGDTTSTPNTVVSLLAEYADETGNRLYVDPYRRLLKGTDPTTPTFYLLPGSGELSWVSEGQATRIFGGWHTNSGAPQVTSVGSGAVEKLVDLDILGPFPDATRPTAILNSILARVTAGGWSGGLTVSSQQIMGRPHLAEVGNAVGRGCMFRLLGQRDPRPGRVPTGFVDFVCERSEWDVNAGTITLTPRGMVARDWAAILSDFGLGDAA